MTAAVLPFVTDVNGQPRSVHATLAVDPAGNVAAAKNVNIVAKQSFTRPADTTAYAAGDLIANSTTAGSVAAMAFAGATIAGGAGSGTVVDFILAKSGSASAQIRAHFFRSAPVVTNGDNGAIAVTSFDLDAYIGYADISVTDAVGGGALGYASGLYIPYALASGDTVYVLLEALAAWTPASGETFTAKIKFERYS